MRCTAQCAIALLTLTISATPALAQAQTPADGSATADDGVAVEMFMLSCLKLFPDKQAFARQMDLAGAPVPAEHAGHYLQGQSGQAWVTAFRKMPYVFSWQDRGMCSMHIQYGDAQALQRQFQQLVASVDPGLEPRYERSSSDDGKRDRHQLVWMLPDRSRAVMVLMSVDPAAQAPLRALISVNFTDPPAP